MRNQKVLALMVLLFPMVMIHGQNSLTLEIQIDYYHNEVSWDIIDNATSIVVDYRMLTTYSAHYQYATEAINLPDGDYSLIFYDTYGDGMSVGNGGSIPEGFFKLKDSGGVVLAEDSGNYGSQSTQLFSLNTTAPTFEIDGYVTRFDQLTYECFPSSRDYPVVNIVMSLNQAPGGSNQSQVTNFSGYFWFPTVEQSDFDLIPTYTDSRTTATAAEDGLDVYDIVAIQQHILKLNKIMCPITRITADYNFDGVIDSTDTQTIADVLLGYSTAYPPEIYRFVPTLLVYPDVSHPDPAFTGIFWNTEYPDQDEIGTSPYFPFDAKLSYGGVTYTYSGPNSWMNKVTDWPFSGNDCSSTSYDFWLLKPGDVNGTETGSSNFSNVSNSLTTETEGHTTANFSSITFEETEIPEASLVKEDLHPEATNKANKLYTLRVSAKCPLPLDAFQLGLQIDPKVFKVKKFKPLTGRIKQNLRKNFNDTQEEKDKGKIRTLWTFGDNGSQGDVDISDWTELLNLEVKLKTNRLPDDIGDVIVLDENLLQAVLVSGRRIINREAEIKIELILLD
jgi:hypothetical protein